jgi:hypothetical protein
LSFDGQKHVRTGDCFVVGADPAYCHVFDAAGKTLPR